LSQQSLHKADLSALPYRHRKLPGYKTRESQSANFATVPLWERKGPIA
jgi:hypothetical protein